MRLPAGGGDDLVDGRTALGAKHLDQLRLFRARARCARLGLCGAVCGGSALGRRAGARGRAVAALRLDADGGEARSHRHRWRDRDTALGKAPVARVVRKAGNRTGKPIEKIGIGTTRKKARAQRSYLRFGSDPQITIPASGAWQAAQRRPATSTHSITRAKVHCFPCKAGGIHTGLFDPVVQRVRRAADLCGNRRDRLPARAVLAFAVQNHAHRAFAHFGGKLVRGLAPDAPSYLGVGTSGKPGSVQSAASHVRDSRITPAQGKYAANRLLRIASWLRVPILLVISSRSGRCRCSCRPARPWCRRSKVRRRDWDAPDWNVSVRVVPRHSAHSQTARRCRLRAARGSGGMTHDGVSRAGCPVRSR